MLNITAFRQQSSFFFALFHFDLRINIIFAHILLTYRFCMDMESVSVDVLISF